MTSGELKVLMALDKLGTYVQNIKPYKIIAGKVFLDSGNATFEPLVNETDYTVEVNGFTGMVGFNISGGVVESDVRAAQLFMGPSQHPATSFNTVISNTSPMQVVVQGYNNLGVLDSRAFGEGTGNPVDVEIRFYNRA